jgi:hypothetical protein
MSRLLALLAATIMIPLSGCLGSEITPDDGTADPTGGSNPTDGTGSPTPTKTQTNSIVKVDPNGTFQGNAHTHDYWGDLKEYQIMDYNVGMGPGGVCVGYLTFACSGGDQFIKFRSPDDESLPPNNVWPGTGKMLITVDFSGTVVEPMKLGVSIPKRSSWDANLFTVDKPTQTFVIDDLQENNTDPPHFRGSGWSFRVQSSKDTVATGFSLYQGAMKIKVTIVRADRELPLDPPHPDFWGGQTQIRLVDDTSFCHFVKASATTYTFGSSTQGYLPPSKCGISVAPPKNSTVFLGTGKMRVELSWTNAYPGQSKPALEVCAAGGSCINTYSIYWRPFVTTDNANSRIYEFEVRPDQWDAAYQTTSEWRFRWVFDNELGVGAIQGDVTFKVDIYKL